MLITHHQAWQKESKYIVLMQCLSNTTKHGTRKNMYIVLMQCLLHILKSMAQGETSTLFWCSAHYTVPSIVNGYAMRLWKIEALKIHGNLKFTRVYQYLSILNEVVSLRMKFLRLNETQEVQSCRQFNIISYPLFADADTGIYPHAALQ